MPDQEYDREKKGYFWIETESKVVRKGTFVIDGVKHYGAIVQSPDFSAQQQGDEDAVKYEFVMSLGRIYMNKDPKSEASPAMGGRVTHNGKDYKLGCWPKENRDGVPFTSLGFKPIVENEQRPTSEHNRLQYGREKNKPDDGGFRNDF